MDVSGVTDGLLRSSMVDGKLMRLPMGLSLKDLVVNKTLLEKEGLTVPQTWQEFLDVLEALKQKGYTPIQGPDNAIFNLCYDMVMTQLNDDSTLLTAVISGDTAGAVKLKTVFERMQTLCGKGYISQEVNAAYPENNYDGAILNFFEGNVPFWFCDTEKVSGMKSANPNPKRSPPPPLTTSSCSAPRATTACMNTLIPGTVSPSIRTAMCTTTR